jgi:hypothetical protein
MKKSTRKTPKASARSFNIQQDDQLLLAYKDNDALIDQLAEIPATIQTYEFLGELIFNYTFRELGQHPPSDQWKAQLKAIRNDVYQLFELARAARALKALNANTKKD